MRSISAFFSNTAIYVCRDLRQVSKIHRQVHQERVRHIVTGVVCHQPFILSVIMRSVSALYSTSPRFYNQNLQIPRSRVLVRQIRQQVCPTQSHGRFRWTPVILSVIMRSISARMRACSSSSLCACFALTIQGERFTGVPRSQETAFPSNPMVGLCLGPCSSPGGGCGFL